MPMIKSDLGRDFTMSVCAAGSVWVQPSGRLEPGTLPVFSTDTREQAEQIQIRHCRKGRESGIYFLNDPPDPNDAVASLGNVSDLFRETFEKLVRA